MPLHLETPGLSLHLKVLDILMDGGKLDRHGRMIGDYLAKGLSTWQEQYSCVSHARGMGLLQGLELQIDGKPLVLECLDHRVLINCTMGKSPTICPSTFMTPANRSSPVCSFHCPYRLGLNAWLRDRTFNENYDLLELALLRGTTVLKDLLTISDIPGPKILSLCNWPKTKIPNKKKG